MAAIFSLVDSSSPAAAAASRGLIPSARFFAIRTCTASAMRSTSSSVRSRPAAERMSLRQSRQPISETPCDQARGGSLRGLGIAFVFFGEGQVGLPRLLHPAGGDFPLHSLLRFLRHLCCFGKLSV